MLIFRSDKKPLTRESLEAVDDVAFFADVGKVYQVDKKWLVSFVRPGVFSVEACNPTLPGPVSKNTPASKRKV